jgi:hypothetical protein
MKRKTFIMWLIPRCLGLLMVWWVLMGCAQPSGSPRPQAEAEETAEEEETEEEQQQQSPEAKLKRIQIGSPPETLLYALGQAFDPEGLIVYGDYDDDTSRELKPAEYTLSAPDTSRSGPQRVRVSAAGYTGDFPIMVNNSDSVLQSISVSAPGGVVRELGQVLGTEGFSVIGHYTEGDQTLSAFSVQGYDRTKRGVQTVTLSVNGQTAELPVRVKVPANAAFYAAVLGTDEAYLRLDLGHNLGHNNVFIKGQDLSLSNVRFYARVTCNNVTARFISGDGITLEDISGFNPDVAGKQTLTLNLDEKSAALDVYAVDKAPEVYFDHGFMRTGDDPHGYGRDSAGNLMDGAYHTQKNKTLVLSPVRVLIGYDRNNNDEGVTYEWTVTPQGDSPALTPPSTTEEFLRLTPTSGGIWNVSVAVTGRNFIDGSTIDLTAQTVVICDTGSLPSGNFGSFKHFAPGQFTESGTGLGWSLGAFGGYWMKTVSHSASYGIEGNGFGIWVEPGIVWFQEDQNQNNLPDEMWYELNVGSDPRITRRYSLTYFKYGGDGYVMNEYGQTLREIFWVDNKGRTGQINGGWPWKWGVSNDYGAWATYTGTLIFDDGIIKGDDYPTAWPNCVDTPQSIFPINEAVAADGSSVNLTNVRFIKVHTGVFKYGGIFGEVSTEIMGLQ